MVDSLAVLFPPGPSELASPGAYYADSQLSTNTLHQKLVFAHIPRWLGWTLNHQKPWPAHRSKASWETTMIQSVWFCKQFIIKKMGWKQVIPVYSTVVWFSNLSTLLSLIWKQTAVPWVYLSYALWSCQASAFVKAFQNSCGLTSSQHFSRPPQATEGHSQTIFFCDSFPPLQPQSKPTVIESNKNYLSKVNLYEEKQLWCRVELILLSLSLPLTPVKTTGGRGLGGWLIKFPVASQEGPL